MTTYPLHARLAIPAGTAISRASDGRAFSTAHPITTSAQREGEARYRFVLSDGQQYLVGAELVRVSADSTKGHAQEYAGLVDGPRRNRLTGSEIAMWRSREAGWDDGEGRYPYTVTCQTHHTTLACGTQAEGQRGMSYPDWCGECRKLLPGARAED